MSRPARECAGVSAVVTDGLLNPSTVLCRFVNMFEVASHDPAEQSVEFARVTGRDGTEHVKGGWQGGRGWQVDHSKINSTNESCAALPLLRAP